MSKRNLLSILLVFTCTVGGYAQSKPVFNPPLNYPNIRDFALSENGKEAYVTAQSWLEEISVIIRLRKDGEQWKEQGIASFSGKYKDLEPFLAQGDLALYFASNRPKEDDSTSLDYDLWKVERSSLEAPWGKPVNLGPVVNSVHNEFYPSLSKNGNLYFTSDRPCEFGLDNIFKSEWTGEKFEEPQPLDSNINSKGYEYNALITIDEQCLVFGAYKRPDGLGSGDLYISCKNKKGKWSAARNLGTEVNSKQMDYCPFYDYKNQMLYYTSKRSNLIDNQAIKSIKDLQNTLWQGENGGSKIYQQKIVLKP